MNSLQKSNVLQFLVEKRQETSPGSEIEEVYCSIVVREWAWLMFAQVKARGTLTILTEHCVWMPACIVLL